MRPHAAARVLRSPALRVAVLLGAFLALAWTSARQHSPAQHEDHYVYAGVQGLRHGAWEIGAGTPAGLLQLAAAPLLLLDLDPRDGPTAEHERSRDLFLYRNRLPWQRILAAARLPFLALGVALGILVFAWARSLYGDAGGFVALAVYVTSPGMIANTQLANQDFGVAAASLASLYALWCLCQQTTPTRVVVTGLALGAALLTKFSAFALLPVGLVVALWDLRRSSPPGRLRDRTLALLGVAAIAGLVVWADYGFAVGTLGGARAELLAAHATGAPRSLCPIGERIGSLSVPAPHFWCGLSSQLWHGSSGHLNYFRGEFSFRGWWSYYLVTILYKVPIPVLLAFALRSLTALRGWRRSGASREAPFLLLFPAVVLALFSASPTQLGERYILLAYPPVFVWLGGLARLPLPAPWKAAGAALLGGWLIVGLLRIHPHHLMYFNEIAGGPTRGWRTLVAGCDLGQDLGNLERYVREREIPEIAVSCKGCEAIDLLDLPQRPLGCRPTSGFVAISVHQALLPCYAWLRPYEPIDRIGYSILVYRIP